MNKFIVTTTINNITPALRMYDNLEGWTLIVIGDKKTPEINLDNGIFIPHNIQDSLGFECARHIPWNVIQRRNLGYLLAIKEGADIIATIDDDNIPLQCWGQDIYVGDTVLRRMISADTICDSLFEHSNVTTEKLWHRGFPIQELENRHKRKEKISKGYVDVQAGLWNGDPDIDAVCRIAGGPFDLEFSNSEFLIDYNCFSPYNTQNTLFSRRISPAMCLLFDIGRMDDIWASYMCQRIMRELQSCVLFTGPTVYQDRNDHDLSVDLEKEVIGYRNTPKFIKQLNEIDFGKSKDVIEMYEKIIDKISCLEFINPNITNFQRAWIKDIKKII
jgi:hypothetical protein